MQPSADKTDLQKALDSKINLINKEQMSSIKEDIKKFNDWQNTPDKASDIAKVPILSLSDIDKNIEKFLLKWKMSMEY